MCPRILYFGQECHQILHDKHLQKSSLMLQPINFGECRNSDPRFQFGEDNDSRVHSYFNHKNQDYQDQMYQKIYTFLCRESCVPRVKQSCIYLKASTWWGPNRKNLLFGIPHWLEMAISVTICDHFLEIYENPYL